jgi:predicted ATPase
MGQDPGVGCRANAATTLWLLGYPAQALTRLYETLALVHELSHPPSLASALWWAAFVSQLRRDVPAVHEQAEAAIALSTERGFPLWAAGGRSLCGWALAMQGQGEEGLVQVHQGLTAWRATGAVLHVPSYAFRKNFLLTVRSCTHVFEYVPQKCPQTDRASGCIQSHWRAIDPSDVGHPLRRRRTPYDG